MMFYLYAYAENQGLQFGKQKAQLIYEIDANR